MRQPMVKGASLISALLVLAVALTWIRGIEVADHISWYRVSVDARHGSKTAYYLFSADGAVLFIEGTERDVFTGDEGDREIARGYWRGEAELLPARTWATAPPTPPAHQFDEVATLYSYVASMEPRACFSSWRRGPFAFLTFSGPDANGRCTADILAVGFPLWLATLALSVAPAWFAARWARHRYRRRHGLCPKCGFDLRASAGSCPECGAPIHPRGPIARRHNKPVADGKSDDILLGSKRSSGRLPPSGTDGTIVAQGLPSNMVHRFIFQKVGYFDAEAIWEEPGRILLLSPSPGANSTPFTPVSDAGVVRIPMYPRAGVASAVSAKSMPGGRLAFGRQS